MENFAQEEMSNCIWNIPVEDRHCECCVYRGCEPPHAAERDAAPVAERYVAMMEDLVGLNIISPSRKDSVVWPRFLVMFQLFRDGYSHREIAKAIGRDRTTVIHAINRVRDMLHYPNFYPSEMRIWLKFQELLSLRQNT